MGPALVLTAVLATASGPVSAAAAGVADARAVAGAAGPAAGVQAAAESLDDILRGLAGYKSLHETGPALRLRAHVAARLNDPAAREGLEARLLAFLEGAAAPGGAMAACRALSLVGTAAAVPVLEKRLLDPATADSARFALERIPGAEADAALVRALSRAGGDVRLGLVATLGARGSAAAAAALERLAGGGGDAAVAAVRGLSGIDSQEAERALLSLLTGSRGPLKSAAASGLLLRAERLSGAGRPDRAAALCDAVARAKPGPVLTEAAFKQHIAALPAAEAKRLILEALSGRDPLRRSAALDMVRAIFGPMDLAALFPAMEAMSETELIRFIAILGDYPGEFVRTTVMTTAGHPAPAVRLEALLALGTTGDGTAVEYLARRAAETAGTEQAMARESLARMRGRRVDRAILRLLEDEDTEDGLRAELLQAAGDRAMAAAKPHALAAAGSASMPVRLRAVRALRTTAGPADLRDMLALLFTIDDENAREEMWIAVAAVANALPRPLARGDAAEALLTAEIEPRRIADLLRVLGRIGDDTALPAVREALNDSRPEVRDAAMRALADWPTVSARDDVMALARDAADLAHKVLALRAAVRLVESERFRAPAAAAADLEKILALAERPEEKRLALRALAIFACPESLRMAQSLEFDATVAEEAKAAASRIANSLAERAKRQR